MDPFTHILSGAVAGRATATRSGSGPLSLNQRMVYGAVAVEFPDIDFLASAFGTLTYLNVHRSITHSFVMAPLWALLLAVLFAVVNRSELKVRDFYILCLLCQCVHIVGDLITPYGTKIFYPLSDHAAALHTTFVIDPIVTGILALGLLASCYLARRRPAAVAAARTGMLLLAVYVGAQGVLHRQALALAHDYRESQGLSTAEVYALPQPLSPFHWKLLLVGKNAYREARVNLAGSEPRQPVAEAGMLVRIWTSYQPPATAPWRVVARFGEDNHVVDAVRAAWYSEPLGDFRRFARFPALYRIGGTEGEFCAYFVDLRFVMEARLPPFRFGACRAAGGGEWVLREDASPGRTG